MSCIDAAIIKALVEHIGMNTDDVTVGGGSSENADIPINITTGSSNSRITIKPDTTADVTLNTGCYIEFKNKDTGKLHRYHCLKFESLAASGCVFIGPYGDIMSWEYSNADCIITTKLDPMSYDVVGMYKINTLSSLIVAFNTVCKFTYEKVKDL